MFVLSTYCVPGAFICGSTEIDTRLAMVLARWREEEMDSVCASQACVRGGGGGCARTIQRWDGVRCAQGPGTRGREAGSSVLWVVKLEEGVQTNELWKETITLYFSGIFLAVYITEYLTVA